MQRVGRWSGVAAAVVAGLAAVGVAAAAQTAAQQPAARLGQGLPPEFAVRAQGAPVSATTSRARTRLREDLGRAGFVTTDARTGGVRMAGVLGGFLTGRSAGEPSTIALDWVREHRDALGLATSDLDDLRLAREYRSADGVTHLIWEQRVDGVPLADADLRANVAADGRLINVGGAPRGGLTLTAAIPKVGARTAYGTVLRSIGSRAAAPAIRSQRGALQRTDFAGDGSAELVAYGAGSSARLAWRTVVPVDRNQDYDALVDAATGEVVRRANLVDFADALVHDNYPGAPAGGQQVVKPIDQWLTPGATTLSGNNAHAFVDADDVVGTAIEPDRIVDSYEEAVPASGEVGPSAGDDWLYPIASVANPAGLCPATPPGCTWNHTVPLSWQTNAKQATTQLFYFVNKFHDYLAAAPIGFDGASGAFERASAAGRGGDPVLAQADDGANTAAGLPDGGHRNNANFDTRPDGIAGRMQMYLFRPPGFAAVNGSDDPQIVYHEYTHGLSNRLVIDAQGFGALDNNQSGAMGEAWSDWYALDLLSVEGLQPDAPAPGDVRMGGYVDNNANLIRSEPVDCRPGDPAAACPGGLASGPGGYTYGDFGKIIGLTNTYTLPEVHADGEIWAQTLWQLRAELVARHGLTEGSRRARAIITGGMRLGPGQPTFLDQRNGILQADAVAGHGDADLIWKTFAARGMGWFASTTGDQDVAPREDFSPPPGPGATGTVRGTVRNDSDGPVAGVVVGLGGHDSGTGPALQATTGADGAYAITGVPQGAYPALTAEAPAGYADAVGAEVVVGAAPVTRDLKVRRNYADGRAGAVLGATNFRDATQYGCGPAKLIDGDQGTAVDTFAPAGQDDPATPTDESAPRFVTVALAEPVAGAEIWIDPTPHCGNLDGNALGRYEVSVSGDGTTFTKVAEGTFGSPDLHRLNRVPSAAVPPVVSHVRLTALRTLGGPDDEGDPLSDGGFLSISELQVYKTPNVPAPQPTAVPTPPPTPAARLKGDLSRTTRNLRASKTGRVTLRVRCLRATTGTLPARCTGTLNLSGKLPRHRRASTLASGRFTIAANRTVTIRLKLSRSTLRALRSRSLSATLRVTIRNPGAASSSARKTVRLLRR